MYAFLAEPLPLTHDDHHVEDPPELQLQRRGVHQQADQHGALRQLRLHVHGESIYLADGTTVVCHRLSGLGLILVGE